MAETAFLRFYSDSRRIVSVRAAKTASRYAFARDARSDLEQEALLELWKKQGAYNPVRGSWRTFCERVVANRLMSVVRSMRIDPADHFRQTPLDEQAGLAAPITATELCADVTRILMRVSEFDQRVAVLLSSNSAVETSRKLSVARSTVYLSVLRLRAAFANAGLDLGSRSRLKSARAVRRGEVKR